MKYILFEDRGIDQFVIFSHLLRHADVARDVGAAQVVSAGFVVFGQGGEACCFGESATLGSPERSSPAPSGNLCTGEAHLRLPLTLAGEGPWTSSAAASSKPNWKRS